MKKLKEKTEGTDHKNSRSPCDSACCSCRATCSPNPHELSAPELDTDCCVAGQTHVVTEPFPCFYIQINIYVSEVNVEITEVNYDMLTT